MTNRRGDPARSRESSRAVERVLRAEQQAQAGLEQARKDAQVVLERARDEALAIVNRALERSGRWQQLHARRLDERAAALRAQADASEGAGNRIDPEAIAAAVDHVAALLTGGTQGDAGDEPG